MNHGIAGDNRGVLNAYITAAEIRDYSTGFPDEQTACRDVPCREALFPEPIEATGGHVGQVQSGCSRPAYTARRSGDPPELTLILFQPRHVPKGKAGADEGKLGITYGRDAETTPIEPGSGAS